MGIDQAKIRRDFPVIEQKVHGKGLVYLDTAATSLKPRQVVEAVSNHYLHESANIHRAVHFLSEQATLKYENARKEVAKFIGATDLGEVIFTSGTTASINLVASSYGAAFVKAGDEILITQMEHHANIVPWQLMCQKRGAVLRYIPINEAGELELDRLATLLNEKTKLVALTQVSNALGTVNPVKEVIEIAHGRNIPVLVDGAQALMHFETRVKDLDCDFLVFSSHKLFGPTGVGVLYGKRKWLEKMPPFLSGGDMIRSVTMEKTEFAELPAKFEAGTPPIAGVIGFAEALRYIDSIGFAAISCHEKEILAYVTSELKKISGLKIIGEAEHKVAIISFVIDGIHPHDIGSILDSEGVAVRTGHHCCQPVMERFKIPATARASFSIYNSFEDVDALVSAIKKAQEIFG